MTDIIKTSASAIESFDDSSAFGCQRRWFFKSVLKVPEPPRDNLTLGTNLHTAIENFLIKGAPGEMKPEVQRLFHAIKPEVIRVRDEGFLALEHPIDFLMAPDVRIIGRIDVLRKNGPLDWKTSSNVAQYAPTPYKLARSTQMLTYSEWQEKMAYAGTSSPSQVTHVYVQTKGTPVTQRIDAVMTPTLLTEGISRVINIAREMKAAQSLPHSPEGANDLRPDRSKCRANTKMPCPYLNICPVEKAAMSSALDRLKARLNTAPMPPAQKAVVDAVKAMPTPVSVQSIVPPDAPPPAPVEKFMAVPPPRSESGTPPKERKLVIQESAPEPTPEVLPSTTATASTAPSAEPTAPASASTSTPDEAPKRGRGRPPGAKNKPKAEAVTLLNAEYTPDRAAWKEALGNVVRSPATDGVVTFKSITVTMTGKLNMGHFQSMDICVSQTAEYTTSPEEAFLQVTNVVKKQLDSALETIAGRTVQAPVPAEVLNSTKR